ncbi:MAG: GTPase domain-containing protein [Promethearchaeota archaeon]
MISNIYIITLDGVVRYFKSFYGADHINNDIVSFLTLITRVCKKIEGGYIRSLNFENFNFVYTYGRQDYVFIVTTDHYDPEDEVMYKLELVKEEFFKRFKNGLGTGNDQSPQIKDFGNFIENNIIIPPKILLAGEDGVGKSTIMNLFPGETVLEIDDEMNEIVEKTVKISNLEGINEFVIREINLVDLVENFSNYKPLIAKINIICIVTNSGAGNLSRTSNLYSRLKERVKNIDFYILANFQDSINSAFEPSKINESFGLKTFGFSAIQGNSRDQINQIIKNMLEISILKKSENFSIRSIKEIKKN